MRSRFKTDPPPYLPDETPKMMRAQRDDEQAGKRRIAMVHANDHDADRLDVKADYGPGEAEDVENTVPQHPDLDSPRFDGADKLLNVNPQTNPKTAADVENELRAQNQLKLGLKPGLGRDRTPRPGSAFGA